MDITDGTRNPYLNGFAHGMAQMASPSGVSGRRLDGSLCVGARRWTPTSSRAWSLCSGDYWALLAPDGADQGAVRAVRI